MNWLKDVRRIRLRARNGQADKRPVGKFAMFSALLGAVWLLAMVVVSGALFPDYDHSAQFISEPGATGASDGFEVSWYGFLPVGILVIAFAFFAWAAAPRTVLSALGSTA